MFKIITANGRKLLHGALLSGVMLTGVTTVLTIPNVARADTLFYGLYATEAEAAARTGPGSSYGYFRLRGRGIGWFVYSGATPVSDY
jgi:hypothetical protein